MAGVVTSHPIIAVTATDWLGLASALMLKEAADRDNLSLAAMAFVLAMVVLVNGLRFLLWGSVYRKHAVSITYPLGATIFPLILVVSYLLYDEPITAPKVVASLM